MAYCAYCGSWAEKVSPAPCPSCGKPLNGTPIRPAASTGTNPAIIVVVVIFAALFGVAILGILAAIAIPNFLNAKQRAQQTRTLADIRVLGSSVELYANDNKTYPRAESMDELLPLIVPKYAQTPPRADAWGNELRYRCTDEQCSGYAISSSGADRIFEHTNAAEYQENRTAHFDCDIVYVNGTFLQSPEGRGN